MKSGCYTLFKPAYTYNGEASRFEGSVAEALTHLKATPV